MASRAAALRALRPDNGLRYRRFTILRSGGLIDDRQLEFPAGTFTQRDAQDWLNRWNSDRLEPPQSPIVRFIFIMEPFV